MNDIIQGSVVLVDFSFSDHQASKLRPALVVSNTGYNRVSRDIVVMKITSKQPKFWSVSVGTGDLLSGSLDYASYARIDSLYTLEKTMVAGAIGVLTPEKMSEIRDRLAELLSV